MTATATHDTKRGEDARARILSLTEVADDWAQAIRRWAVMNAGLITQNKQRAPSRAHEYMLYQALIGAWPEEGVTPAFVERMQSYAIKAAREGKQATSWTNPNENYEKELKAFIARLLDSGKSSDFLQEFESFAARARLLGALNSFSQLALKATVPGVPDFYQGTELGDFSLVDPDNRRPVDFSACAEMLLGRYEIPESTSDAFGRLKFALTRRLLGLRMEFSSVFSEGRYESVATHGAQAKHVIAFARVLDGVAVVVVTGRHFAPLTSGGMHWPRHDAIEAYLELNGFHIIADKLNERNLKASGTLPVSTVFAQVPVGVLLARAA